MASVYGVVRTLFDSVPRYPVLRDMLRRKASPPTPAPAYRQLVENEIVPRLMLSHACGPSISQETIDPESFASLALGGDAAQLLSQTEALIDAGHSVDSVLIDGLAPAARSLGAMWDDDRADFVEVTMALWRMQEVMRELSARAAIPRPAKTYRALFAVMPGEQHSFGAAMVEDVFRRTGWDTVLLAEGDRQVLLAEAANTHFDIIGLSVGADRFASEAGATIRALRSVSHNPHVAVMLGGRCFADADERTAAAHGADAVSGDARDALAVAQSLVEARRELPV